jgi:hypothetical protein
MSCDGPDCGDCRLSKRKWDHRELAFVLPPRPIGCNPYYGTPPVFGSQMSAAAGSGDKKTAFYDEVDRRCDEPSDFDFPGPKYVSISSSILFLAFYANDNSVLISCLCDQDV